MARIKQQQTPSLVFQRAIGTNARGKNGISVAKSTSTLAYLNGAGAIVIHTSNPLLQKFFCTSTKYNQYIYADDLTCSNTTTLASTGSLEIPSLNTGLGLGLGLGIGGIGSGGDVQSPGSASSASSAKDKLKPCNAVALSPDGTWLATGEMGHQPRVFVYSTRESTSTPSAILSEHSFGIQALAFSPCGKYLATLGTRNDGFLHIWSVPDFRLITSNRCTSLINSLVWLSSTQLLTAGLRHLRLWTLNMPSSALPSLLARNVVLRSHIESTFSKLVRVSDTLALVVCDSGRLATVCCNKDSDTASFELRQQFTNIQALDICPVSGSAYVVADHRLLTIDMETFEPIVVLGTECVYKTASALFVMQDKSILAVVDNCLVELRDNEPQQPLIPMPQGSAGGSISGMSYDSKLIAIWGTDSKIRVWDHKFSLYCDYRVSQGRVSAVQCSETLDLLVAGTTDGTVELLRLSTSEVVATIYAHGSTVQDICIRDRTIVTCSRDRTIQILHCDKQSQKWAISQTILAHKANILRVLISKSGDYILSCSADRTIHIHKLIDTAFVSERVISLRSTPTDMALHFDNSHLVVSCTDKTVSHYSIHSGELKTVHRDDIDLKCISVVSIGKQSYLAASASDKSIRLYELSSGILLGVQWAHCDGIVGVLVIENGGPMLVTAGSEGCVCLWQIIEQVGEDSHSHNSNNIMAKAPAPTRKFLSKSEIARIKGASPPTTPRIVSSPSPPAKVAAPPRNPAARRSLSYSKSFPSLNGATESNRRAQNTSKSIEDAIKVLAVIRTRFDKSVIHSHPEQVARLKAELQSTLRLLSGTETAAHSARKTARMDEMLQHFGDQLVSLVDTKLRM